MTEFPACAANAEMEFIVDHQSAADARANRKDGNRVETAARAEAPFAVGDRTHIVQEKGSQAGGFCNRIAQWDMRPCAGQVRKE